MECRGPKGALPRRDRRAIGLRNLPPAIVGGANTRLVRLLAALKMGSRQEWGSPTNDHIHCELRDDGEGRAIEQAVLIDLQECRGAVRVLRHTHEIADELSEQTYRYMVEIRSVLSHEQWLQKYGDGHAKGVRLPDKPDRPSH